MGSSLIHAPIPTSLVLRRTGSSASLSANSPYSDVMGSSSVSHQQLQQTPQLLAVRSRYTTIPTTPISKAAWIKAKEQSRVAAAAVRQQQQLRRKQAQAPFRRRTRSTAHAEAAIQAVLPAIAPAMLADARPTARLEPDEYDPGSESNGDHDDGVSAHFARSAAAGRRWHDDEALGSSDKSPDRPPDQPSSSDNNNDKESSPTAPAFVLPIGQDNDDVPTRPRSASHASSNLPSRVSPFAFHSRIPTPLFQHNGISNLPGIQDTPMDPWTLEDDDDELTDNESDYDGVLIDYGSLESGLQAPIERAAGFGAKSTWRREQRRLLSAQQQSLSNFTERDALLSTQTGFRQQHASSRGPISAHRLATLLIMSTGLVGVVLLVVFLVYASTHPLANFAIRVSNVKFIWHAPLPSLSTPTSSLAVSTVASRADSAPGSVISGFSLALNVTAVNKNYLADIVLRQDMPLNVVLVEWLNATAAATTDPPFDCDTIPAFGREWLGHLTLRKHKHQFTFPAGAGTTKKVTANIVHPRYGGGDNGDDGTHGPQENVWDRYIDSGAASSQVPSSYYLAIHGQYDYTQVTAERRLPVCMVQRLPSPAASALSLE
ncbi:hypothetical protein BC828DRAFT_392521 [Blastocladiella britannica]|nr:hypothetical protein BC828DRAFT_392521 [Blastocladiella britannica]